MKKSIYAALPLKATVRTKGQMKAALNK